MASAVIFDMDGILIDSEPLWKQAQINVFKDLNIGMSIEMCALTMGYRTSEVIDYWFERLPWKGKSKGEVTEELITRAQQMIVSSGQVMKGVNTALESIKRQGLKIALASSSPLRIIHAVVDKLNIRDYFDVIQSAENEPYGKPHPAVFLAAAMQLNITPQHCLVIEDSINGVIAAKAARMKVVAVPDPAHYDDKRFAIADYILPNLEAFDIPQYKFL